MQPTAFFIAPMDGYLFSLRFNALLKRSDAQTPATIQSNIFHKAREGTPWLVPGKLNPRKTREVNE
jgi:hypothetical protein